MLIIFFVALFLTIVRYPTEPWTLPSLLAFAFLFPFLAGLINIHQSQWIAINTENVPIDPEGPGIPREVSVDYRQTVAGLTPLGFKPVLSYSKTKLVPNAIAFSTLFKNDKTSEVATLINTFGSGGIVRIKVSLLVFRTEFADGTEVLTSNSNFPSQFPPEGPPVHGFIFPQVRDPGRLYTVHQAVVSQFEGRSPRRDPIGDDPDGYLRRIQQREFARFLACGYYYLDEARGVQRPTWKGAIMATLKLIWPVKAIRKIWRRWKAARMLRELGMA
jgi:hypothetical protein